MKLLIVENDLANAAIIKRFLQGTYEIDVAYESKTASAFIENNSYDAYLLDINLGEDTTGIDLLTQIKNQSSYTGQPLITVTAYASTIDRQEFMKQGFTHYIAKPVEKYKLLELVNGAIESHKQLQ